MHFHRPALKRVVLHFADDSGISRAPILYGNISIFEGFKADLPLQIRENCSSGRETAAVSYIPCLKSLRGSVFYPSFLLMSSALAAAVFLEDRFLTSLSNANAYLLSATGPGIQTAVLVMVVVCAAVPFTPLGKLRIGGSQAVPFLSKTKWFAIVLCTTIATGILFWATAEPVFHFIEPPENTGIRPESKEALHHALAVLFLHWSFSPYAIYTIPALVFAVGYYNKRKSYSTQSALFPLKFTGGKRWSTGLDNFSLFALVMGMSASLGAGILTLKGGLERNFEIGMSDAALSGFIALAIVAAFTASASTGLMRGIKNLSLTNFYIFIAILVFVVFTGFPAAYSFLGPALSIYITGFFDMSLSVLDSPEWSNAWTTFNWTNWMAWAPVTALFLGRLAYGRTVREFIAVNWLLPALFAVVWMTVFGGNVLHLQYEGLVDLKGALQAQGPESLIYLFFEALPMAPVVTAIFLFAVFLSYTTAADSNTEAMGGISSTGISPESPSPPIFIKITWGTLIGATAYIAINFAGIDGIKMLSNLGGFPAAVILVLSLFSLVKMMWTGEWRDQ